MSKKKLKQLIEDPKLIPFLTGVEEFCATYLKRTSHDREARRKIIADPIEGYCSLTPWEVSIVDTPLFQRLRSIKQLGLAYVVYPTLAYSRFEHVLGVRSRLDQIINTLQNNHQLMYNGHSFLLFPSHYLEAMRLATLCHDIGHCIFSHVSESVIDDLKGKHIHPVYPSGKQIRDIFYNWAGRKIAMAEILSMAIITSPSFVSFLSNLHIPNNTGYADAHEMAINASHLIAGLPIPGEPMSMYLGQILSSGLDIDKLDYMFREALFSGISLGVSLDWLLKKLFVITLPAEQLPIGLRSRTKHCNSSKEYAILAIERGGQFAFEEFCVARLALHEKIYLHRRSDRRKLKLEHYLVN